MDRRSHFGNEAETGSGLFCGGWAAGYLQNCIFSWGLGGAAVESDCLNTPVVNCCDIFANEGGDWVGCIAGQFGVGGNFSADPLLCDAANGDYTLDASSPCLPGNHPQGVDCGLIGTRGLGCGTHPPTGACCLADGSCVALDASQCAAQQGIYMGDGTTCGSNPCQPTPVRFSTWGRIKASYR